MAAELVQQAIAYSVGRFYVDLVFPGPIGVSVGDGYTVQHQSTIIVWISRDNYDRTPPNIVGVQLLDSRAQPVGDGIGDIQESFIEFGTSADGYGVGYGNGRGLVRGHVGIDCLVLEGHSLPNGGRGFRFQFGGATNACVHGSTWWGLDFKEYTQVSVASGTSPQATVTNAVPVGTPYGQFTTPEPSNSWYLQFAAVAWVGPTIYPTYDNGATFIQRTVDKQPTNTIALTPAVTGNYPPGWIPGHVMQPNTELRKHGDVGSYTWQLSGAPQDWVAGLLTIMDPPPPPIFNYHGWETLTLSPAILGGPALCQWAPGNMHLFARRSDNNLYWGNLRNGVWYGWTNLGGPIACDPQVVSFGDGWMDVFASNPAGNVMHRRYFNSHWEPWENLGGGAKVGQDYVIGCASMAYGRIDLFVIGTDNVIYQRIYRNLAPGADRYPTGWGQWQQFWPANHGFVTGLVATGSPYGNRGSNADSFATNDIGQIELAGIANNGNLWHRSYNSIALNGTFPYTPGPGWQSWENLGGFTIGRPGIATNTHSHPRNTIDIFARGSFGQLHQNHFQTASSAGNPWPSGRWSGWALAGGPVNGYGVFSSPGACYGYTRQTSSDPNDGGLQYPTWDAVVVDIYGKLRRVAWYGDKPAS